MPKTKNLLTTSSSKTSVAPLMERSTQSYSSSAQIHLTDIGKGAFKISLMPQFQSLNQLPKSSNGITPAHEIVRVRKISRASL